MVAFGSLSLASILANIGFIIKYYTKKEKTPENVTIPYTQGRGEIELETFVMHIGGTPRSTEIPNVVVKE